MKDGGAGSGNMVEIVKKKYLSFLTVIYLKNRIKKGNVKLFNIYQISRR